MGLSGHPLSEYEEELSKKVSCTSRDFEADEDGRVHLSDGQKVIFGGIINSKKVKYTKNNKVMAFINVEDMYGSVEVVVFPNSYALCQNFINADEIVIVNGKADISSEGDGKIIAEKITPIDSEEGQETEFTVPDKLFLKVPNEKILQKAARILKTFPGDIPVVVKLSDTGSVVKASKDMYASEEEIVIDGLKMLLGDENVVMKYKKTV